MYTGQKRTNNLMKNGYHVPENYHWRPLVRKEDARLSENGLPHEQRDFAWNQLRDHLSSHQTTFLGFQANQSLDCERITQFLGMALNNCGDPFSTASLDAMNTKVMECAVLDYFAKLWGIQQTYPSNEEERAYWGYITSMGCSEGNLLALFNARDYLAGMPLNKPILEPHLCKALGEDVGTNKTEPNVQISGHVFATRSSKLPDAQLMENPNNFSPVVFFSEESYHGFEKAIQMFQMKTFCDIGSGNFSCPLQYPDDYPISFNDELLDQNGWPRAVPVEEDGSISISCLVKLVTPFVSRGYPPLVVFTMGTTFKGAHDNAQSAIIELVPVLKQHNMYERRVYSSEDPTKSDIRNGFWFHIDGALSGAHLRFLEMANNEGLVHNIFPNGFPVFDFRIPEVKSISMSLHKWLGCPFPSALFMIRAVDQVKPHKRPLYIGGLDNTLSGSRGGHTALIMWDLISKKSYDDFKEIAVRGVHMVTFTLNQLRELEKELRIKLWVSHAPGSLFVYFRQPRQDIVCCYSLGSKLLRIKTVDGTFEDRIYSHICLMPHVTKTLVSRLIEELRAPGAFTILN